MAAASQGQGGLALPTPSGLEGRLAGGLAEKGAGGGGREGCIDAQSSAQDGRWGQKEWAYVVGICPLSSRTRRCATALLYAAGPCQQHVRFKAWQVPGALFENAVDH